MPPSGITLTSACLPACEIPKLATRIWVRAFFSQPAGKVYCNGGWLLLSGASIPSGMAVGMEPGIAAGAATGGGVGVSLAST